MTTSPSSSLGLASNDATNGCLSSILRRILCSNLRDTSLRDCEEEYKGIGIALEPKAEQQKLGSPGIVARLMGLESMPVHPYTPPDLMRRSRSASSLESWPVFITGHRKRGSPEIKTSMSFREVPTFLRQENEAFLLLSFTHEDEGEIFAMAPKEVKPTMVFAQPEEKKYNERSKAKEECEMQRRNEERKIKKRNETRRNVYKKHVSERNQTNVKDSSPPQKKNVDRNFGAGMTPAETMRPTKCRRSGKSKFTKKSPVRSQRMVEVECSKDNSSPDSVLEDPFDHMDGDHFISISSPVSEDNRPKRNNQRRLPSPELEILNCTSPSVPHSTITRDSLHKDRTYSRKPKEKLGFKQSRDQPISRFADIWGQVCLLAEEDVKKTNWIFGEMQRSEETTEIIVELELEIFDLLLLEAVAGCSWSTRHTMNIVH